MMFAFTWKEEEYCTNSMKSDGRLSVPSISASSGVSESSGVGTVGRYTNFLVCVRISGVKLIQNSTS